MADLAEIVLCPRCNGEMSRVEMDLCCDCGYRLIFSEGFFGTKDGVERTNSYVEFYTEEYYKSSLYDYTSYRLDKIVALARPGPGRRIIDLGCGPGEIAIRCAKMDAEVYGIDVSKDALRLSSERCAREKVRVRLFEFDGEKVPFKESMFDSIILSDVVEHVEDETLDLLLGECARLLKSDGRLIIHTSPARNIIHLTKIIKSASFGRYDLHARLVNPDYEHLHVRYHSLGSLRRLLKTNSLYPIMWGEVQYLADSKLAKLLGRLGMGEIFSDQIWSVAFKDQRFLPQNHGDKPFFHLIEPLSEIDLGKCDDIYLNYGFYDSELDRFRWTGRRCSLFINVPEGRKRLEIELQTSNPDVRRGPVRANLWLGEDPISSFDLCDSSMKVLNFEIDEDVRPGMTELKLEVDRTFVPRELGMNDDPRDLGVAIYRVAIF